MTIRKATIHDTDIAKKNSKAKFVVEVTRDCQVIFLKYCAREDNTVVTWCKKKKTFGGRRRDKELCTDWRPEALALMVREEVVPQQRRRERE